MYACGQHGQHGRAGEHDTCAGRAHRHERWKEASTIRMYPKPRIPANCAGGSASSAPPSRQCCRGATRASVPRIGTCRAKPADTVVNRGGKEHIVANGLSGQIRVTWSNARDVAKHDAEAHACRTMRSQHSHSTVTAQSHPSHSTAAARPPHSHSTCMPYSEVRFGSNPIVSGRVLSPLLEQSSFWSLPLKTRNGHSIGLQRTTQSQHSNGTRHSTVTAPFAAQTQHSPSTSTAQPRHRVATHHSVTAQSQHSHSTVTAQGQHTHSTAQHKHKHITSTATSQP